MAIKWISGMIENPASGRSRLEAQKYWAESHGTLNANVGANLRRYHHYFSLPEAYESEPKATFIGITMVWPRDPSVDWSWQPGPPPSPPTPEGWIPWRADDRNLFDRRRDWPLHEQHARIQGEEHVIIDGKTTPSMVNAIFMVTRLPGLDHRDFFEHWSEVQGPLATKLPGLRRYIQNHADLDWFRHGTQTHDGWSELWFDDYAAFQRAIASPEWQAMEADGRTLFCAQKGVVIGHEYVQKDESWQGPRDFGALALTEDQIRARLLDEGYKALLETDPAAPAKIKAAVAKGKLGVWTVDHLVTLDDSRIDERPAR